MTQQTMYSVHCFRTIRLLASLYEHSLVGDSATLKKIQINAYLMASLGKLVGHPAPDVGRHLRQLVQLGGEAGHAERPVAREFLQPATTSTTRGLARGACLAVQGLCGS